MTLSSLVLRRSFSCGSHPQQLRLLRRTRAPPRSSLAPLLSTVIPPQLPPSMMIRGFATAKKKPQRKKMSPSSSTAGRIALTSDEAFAKKQQKNKNVRVCSGCGTAVVRGTHGGGVFSTGEAAGTALSKNQAKKARYFDVGDVTDSNFLCSRCKSLRKDDIWSAYDALRDVDASVFAAQLRHIVSRRKFGMCVVVVDATDPEHSAPKQLRQKMIGSTPAILVLTKADLVPRLQKPELKRLQYQVRNITGMRQFLATFRVSAVTGAGMLPFVEYLLNNLGGRDVFVVGSANVGKSTLVQRLAATIAPNIYLKGQARQAHKRKQVMTEKLQVTASHLPGTTLQAVRVPCFASSRHALWDTPGIIQKKAVQYNLFPPHLMEPLARPAPISLERTFTVRSGYSILLEAAWMREDYEEKEGEEETDEEDEYDKEDYDVEYFEYEHYNKPRPKRSSNNNVSFNQNVEDMGCILGRVDVVDVQQRGLSVRPFLHPSLRVHVVPTSQAPEHATIPEAYVQRIQSRMRQKKSSAFNDKTSRPLAAFITKENPEGLLRPVEKDRNYDNKVFMDLSFASLGYLSLACSNPDFTLKPWCVKGSVYSKRRSLYPMNLSEQDVAHNREEMMEEAASLDTEEAQRRIDDASRHGRKSSGQSIEDREQPGADDEYWMDEDEWY